MNETTKQEKGLEPVNESEPKIDETELNEVYKKAREYDVIINDYNALFKFWEKHILYIIGNKIETR